MKYISKVYEVVVFTSSDKSYANAVLDYIDPDHTLIHHRFFREHCVAYAEDFYIKDLRILNRNLRNVIIVDNAPYAFGYQLDNGYPIIPFINSKKDRELKVLTEYLNNIAKIEDVRDANREKFKLQWLCTVDAEEFLKYYIANNGGEESLDIIKAEFQQSLSSYFTKLD